MTDCVFCDKLDAGDYDTDHGHVVSFKPLDPVTPGHTLFVPWWHAGSAAEDVWGAGEAVRVAALDAASRDISANIITSIGTDATQTVFHTHIHLVPRHHGDGLALPWT